MEKCEIGLSDQESLRVQAIAFSKIDVTRSAGDVHSTPNLGVKYSTLISASTRAMDASRESDRQPNQSDQQDQEAGARTDLQHKRSE
jgi:hypothetical protein